MTTSTFLRATSSPSPPSVPTSSNEPANSSTTECLSLRYSNLDQIPGFLYTLKNLVNLNLSHNALKELPKPFFVSLRNLRVLYLAANQLSTLSDFSKLSKLQTLCFSNNRLSNQAIDHAHLDKLHHLTNLYLAQNDLGPDVPETIGRCGKLTTLSLTKNRIVDVDRLSKLTSLEWLGLSDNQLTCLPSSLGMLKKLEGITLWGNPMDDGSVATNINLNLTVVVAKARGHEEAEVKSNPDISFAFETARDSSNFSTSAIFPDESRNSGSQYSTYTLTRSHKGPEPYLSLSSALMAIRSEPLPSAAPSKPDEIGDADGVVEGEIPTLRRKTLSPITETLLPFSDKICSSVSTSSSILTTPAVGENNSPDVNKQLQDEISEVLRKMNEGETILKQNEEQDKREEKLDLCEEDGEERTEETTKIRRNKPHLSANTRPRLRNSWVQVPGKSLSPIESSPLSAAPEFSLPVVSDDPSLPGATLPPRLHIMNSKYDGPPSSVSTNFDEQQSPMSSPSSPVTIISGSNLGCWKCNKSIGENEEAVGAVEKTWHLSCFSCNSCGAPLVDMFYEHNGQPYCQTDYDMLQLMFGEEEEGEGEDREEGEKEKEEEEEEG